MEIILKRIEDIKPYEKNPRKNDKAVDAVANSIKEFGFKNPIVIDKNGVIVNGHTRYKASKKLHIKEVPCIIADDLTEEQIKAFRLADNKVSELAEWDLGLLDGELDNILNIDMSEFGFELNFDVEDAQVGKQIRAKEFMKIVQKSSVTLVRTDNLRIKDSDTLRGAVTTQYARKRKK